MSANSTATWSQDRVFAESSLIGERVVSIVRIAMIGCFAVSRILTAAFGGRPLTMDAVMVTTVSVYTAAAIALAFFLRASTPDPKRARVAPIFLTIADFTFVTIMGWRHDQLTGSPHPEMTAASCSVVLCYSVARFNWHHVAFSTLLACAAFLTRVAIARGFDFNADSFVVSAFVALGILMAWTNRRVRRMFLDMRRRDSLSRFLPRPVVDRVLAGDAGVLDPVQREITVLFYDLRDFTALTETMSPRDVLALLDSFHGRMARIVKGQGGVVLKFLGDGMMAAWGVPNTDERHAHQALAAALEMRSALEAFNASRNGQALRMGIGIHTGQVAAGMLGGDEQSEYAVIGDTVNVASRVEGLTKTLGADILATEHTWKLLEGKFDGERVAEERVRGRKEPVTVYSVKRSL